MKDIELLLPMLREFFDERGLNEVRIDLTIHGLPDDVLSQTYATLKSVQLDGVLTKWDSKKNCKNLDCITLESKYF